MQSAVYRLKDVAVAVVVNVHVGADFHRLRRIRVPAAFLRPVVAGALCGRGQRLGVFAIRNLPRLVLVLNSGPLEVEELFEGAALSGRPQAVHPREQFFTVGRQAVVHHLAVEDDAAEIPLMESRVDELSDGLLRVVQSVERQMRRIEDE